ncbi:MAG: hypothetical protein IIX45_05715 [Lachnospiraceae bacterium]|nr:hypothetical protein [Lachnospiraceae bacterium]
MDIKKSAILKEKLTGIVLCLTQLLFTIILLTLLLFFKHFTAPVYILLAFILLTCFVVTFLSQQSRYYRMIGRYVSLAANLLLIVSCIACFII